MLDKIGILQPRWKELKDLEERSGRTLELVSVADQVEDSVLRYLRADGREVRPGGRRKKRSGSGS